MTELRRDILLSAADWQSRTLILAELQELGYEVMAVPGVRYAIQAALKGLVDPPLLIIDVHHDPDATYENVEGLLSLFPERPVILLVGVFEQRQWEPLRGRVTHLFRRPIRIGDVVGLVKALAPPPTSPEEDASVPRSDATSANDST